jgi:hypothetical protein
MIRQRVNAGLTRAVEAGKQLGRPWIDPALQKRIQSQLPAGKGMLKFAVPAVERHCGNLLSDVVALNTAADWRAPSLYTVKVFSDASSTLYTVKVFSDASSTEFVSRRGAQVPISP